MKKLLLISILQFLFIISCFSFEPFEFNNSSWLSNVDYEDSVIERNTVYNWFYDILSFTFPKVNNPTYKEDLGYFHVNGLDGNCVIYSVNKKTDSEFVFVYGFIPNEITKDHINEKDVYTGILRVIDENTISFTDCPYQGSIFSEPFHRLTNPNKKSIKAFVNDNNVRMRSEPNTNGIIYGKVNKGTQVLVIDQSGVSKANENVWYQIQIKNWPICWIFGEYITLEK